jgi:hypothetical protein
MKTFKYTTDSTRKFCRNAIFHQACNIVCRQKGRASQTAFSTEHYSFSIAIHSHGI